MHFFVIHAPRQSGKTTLLNALEQKINAGCRYYALYCSMESVQGMTNLEQGIPAIVRSLGWAVRYHPALKAHSFAEGIPLSDFNNLLRAALVNLCEKLDRPVVLFLDEADCLGGDTLTSFLRQLRDGYVNRMRAPLNYFSRRDCQSR